MKKVFATIMVASLGVFALTGCASQDIVEEGDFFEEVITLKDGRTVACVVFNRSSYDSGISCDWDNATKR